MMNTRHPTISRTARIAAGSLLAVSALAASTASTFAAKGGSGAIWTTNESCETPAAQDDNLYAVGETVYLRGKNFDANVAVSWTITGLPGGASSDPKLVVASGSASTDGDGYFCITAYTVLVGDAGEYKAEVSRGNSTKKDNYRVDAPVQSVGGDPVDPGTTTTPPTQVVEGETDAVTPPVSIDLPPTDTIDGSTGTAPSVLIFGLGALAGLAALLAPNRRRTAVEQA